MAQAISKKIGGDAQSVLPEVALNLSSTAHILGGCKMGKDANEGVIDKNANVFGYKNMKVCDGSMVSANLGVNPSLTITALSEWAMDDVEEKKQS